MAPEKRDRLQNIGLSVLVVFVGIFAKDLIANYNMSEELHGIKEEIKKEIKETRVEVKEEIKDLREGLVDVKLKYVSKDDYNKDKAIIWEKIRQ